MLQESVSSCDSKLFSLCSRDTHACVLLGVFSGLKETLRVVERLSSCLKLRGELKIDECFYLASESLGVLHSIMHDLRPLASYLESEQVIENIGYCISAVEEMFAHSSIISRQALAKINECIHRIKLFFDLFCERLA